MPNQDQPVNTKAIRPELFRDDLLPKHFYKSNWNDMGLYKHGQSGRIQFPFGVVRSGEMFYVVEKRDQCTFLIIFNEIIGEITPNTYSRFFLVAEEDL